MQRYWVEFTGYDGVHVCIYIHAYNPDQIREMLSEYELISVDQTD